MAEQTIKMGVIGTGMGRLHMEQFARVPDVRIHAVCDLNRDEARSCAEAYEAKHVFTDYQDLIAVEELDAVSIAVPNFLHAPMAVAALNAGKHVLCEKPMATTLADAQAMVDAADRARVRLMIHQNQRFEKNAQILAHYRDKGEFGEIYYGRAAWIRRKGFPVLNFSQSGSMARGTWFLEQDKAGGGALFDIGVHMLDLAWYLMGSPKPLAVSGATYLKVARETLRARNLPTELDELAAAQIRFENGASLHVTVCWDAHQAKFHALELFGDRAGASLFPARIYRGADVMETVECSVPYGGLPVETAAAHFVSRIRAPELSMIASGEEIIEVIRMLFAIQQSAARQREVVLSEGGRCRGD